jgi:hypothetical protein
MTGRISCRRLPAERPAIVERDRHLATTTMTALLETMVGTVPAGDRIARGASLSGDRERGQVALPRRHEP